VYKQPNISQSKIDDLANVFLIGTDISDLPVEQQANARNMTESIFVVQQSDENVTVNFVNDVSVEPDASGGVVNAVSTPVPNLYAKDTIPRQECPADMPSTYRKVALKPSSSRT
jgi:hypothetical protein